MQNMIRTIKLALTLGLVACTSSIPVSAQTAWARCDNCTAWQRSNAAAARVAEVALSQLVNKRVAIVDFETSNHTVVQLTGYFDYELRSYTTQIFQTTPTAAEIAEFAALETVYRDVKDYIDEAQQDGEEPPRFAYPIDINSAFDYWGNPGLTRTRINNLVYDRFNTAYTPGVIDRAKMAVILEEGTKLRLVANDGTFITVKAHHMFMGLNPDDVEFTVTELQLPDGSAIPLVRRDLDDDWASIIVPGGPGLAILLDNLAANGVRISIVNGTSTGPFDSIDPPRTIIECASVNNIPDCTVTPVPEAE